MVLAAVLGCTASGAAGHQGRPMEIVLQIFSGRENPSVVVSPEQARDIAEVVRQLPPTGPVPVPDGLGYRGFVIQPSVAADSTARVHVYGGTVWDGATVRRDSGRALEKRLFALIAPALEPSVRSVVEADLRR